MHKGVVGRWNITESNFYLNASPNNNLENEFKIMDHNNQSVLVPGLWLVNVRNSYLISFNLSNWFRESIITASWTIRTTRWDHFLHQNLQLGNLEISFQREAWFGTYRSQATEFRPPKFLARQSTIVVFFFFFELCKPCILYILFVSICI